MRARDQKFKWWAVIPMCLTACGCAGTGAPDGWLSTAADAPQDPYGAWVTVTFVKSQGGGILAGEFLAVDQDSLYILSDHAGQVDPVMGVPLEMIKKARIASFDPETAQAGGWVAAGAVSTLSHGIGAGLTMPLWIIMGSLMAAGQSRTPLENYPDLPWSELNMYARFPQGPPPDLHQLGLRPKRQER